MLDFCMTIILTTHDWILDLFTSGRYTRAAGEHRENDPIVIVLRGFKA